MQHFLKCTVVCWWIDHSHFGGLLRDSRMDFSVGLPADADPPLLPVEPLPLLHRAWGAHTLRLWQKEDQTGGWGNIVCTLLVLVVFINILLYVLMSVMKSRDYDFGQKTPPRSFLDLSFFSPEDTSRYRDIKGEPTYRSTKSHRKYKEAHLVTFSPVRVLKPI